MWPEGGVYLELFFERLLFFLWHPFSFLRFLLWLVLCPHLHLSCYCLGLKDFDELISYWNLTHLTSTSLPIIQLEHKTNRETCCIHWTFNRNNFSVWLVAYEAKLFVVKPVQLSFIRPAEWLRLTPVLQKSPTFCWKDKKQRKV